MGGVFLCGSITLRVGSDLTLVFEVPGGMILAEAAVRNTVPGEGMGVEFTKMNPESRALLEGLLVRLLRNGTPPPAFCEKSLQAIENKRWELQKDRQEISRGGKLLKRWDLPQRHREHRGGEGMDGKCRRGDTPVATGSMRNLLRMGEILAPRGAYDGRSRRLREHTPSCGEKEGRVGDTVSRTFT
jgi:hypothetical protein